MAEKHLEQLVTELTKDVIRLQETQANATKSLDKVVGTLESITGALKTLDVIGNEVKHIKQKLEEGTPTIKECDSRGKLTELKVERLERVVYGTVGLTLTALVGYGLTKLIGV